MIPHPLNLEGKLIQLKPLKREHIAPLMAIARAHPEAFRLTSTPITDAQADAYFGRAFRERDANLAYPFVILEAATGRVLGSTRYSDIRWGHRNCEIGYTWIEPGQHGSGVNLESKFLMLQYAFEGLDFLRVFFYTDTRNEHSQRAIRALGAVQEGTLRCHMVTKDGFVRDSLIFSIVYHEWPEVRERLLERLQQKLGANP